MDFDWSPETVPSDFLQERLPPSPAFARIVETLELPSSANSFERALQLAEHLTSHAQDRGPIQADLETTYARILEGYGYCADFVKVFLALAHGAGLHARQWAFSFDGFGGHGHTFVEVYDPRRRKWLFLDVFNNVYACNRATREPLSALEFRRALLTGEPAFEIKRAGEGRLGFPILDKLLAYYRRGLNEWYLIWGNAVFSHEARPLIRWASKLSSGMGQAVAVLVGAHPSIKILCTPENRAVVQELTSLQRRVKLALSALAAMALILAGRVGYAMIQSR